MSRRIPYSMLVLSLILSPMIIANTNAALADPGDHLNPGFGYRIADARWPILVRYATSPGTATQDSSSIHLSLFESDGHTPIGGVAYILEVSATESATNSSMEYILRDVFFAENGTLALNLVHSDGQPRIQNSYQEQFLNAWVAQDDSTEQITFTSPDLIQGREYLLNATIIGLDGVRNILNEKDWINVALEFDLSLASSENRWIGSRQSGLQVSQPVFNLNSQDTFHEIRLDVRNDGIEDEDYVTVIQLRDENDIVVEINYTQPIRVEPDESASSALEFGITRPIQFMDVVVLADDFANPLLLHYSTHLLRDLQETGFDVSRIIDRPLNFTAFKEILLSVEDTTSINPNLELQADIDANNNTVIFYAKNLGSSVEQLNVSHWRIHRSYGGYASNGERIDGPNLTVINPGHSSEIARETIEFDPFQGTGRTSYGFDLEGFNRDDALGGNRVDYGIEITVSFDYNATAIAEQSVSRLLRSDNMFLAINGTGPPFDVDDSHPRSVDIFLVNDGNQKIGSDIGYMQFAVWPLAKPGVMQGMSANADYFDTGECGYLEPGERKRIDAFAMSKTFWPVDRVAAELEDPYPGIYMFHYHVSIRSCTLDSGEYVAGGSKVLVAAFMVN